MYNATCLWAPQRLATRLRVLQRASIQRNDLFVTFRIFALRLSTRLVSARCDAPLRNATQRFVCYFAPQLAASRHPASRHPASHLNATICLLQRLSTRLGFSQGTTAPRRSPRLNSTQRFVCYFASLQSAALRNSTRLSAALLSAIQRNELKLN